MNINTMIEIEHLINKVNELNQQGCFENYADYSFLIDKLTQIKESHNLLMAYSLSLFSSFRIDVITSPYIEHGTAKMILNIEDFHIMMVEHDNKLKTPLKTQ